MQQDSQANAITGRLHETFPDIYHAWHKPGCHFGDTPEHVGFSGIPEKMQVCAIIVFKS